MSLDGAAVRTKTDALIREAADSGAAPQTVVYKKLVTAAADSSPYDEHTNKIYETTGVTVIAWIKIEPEGPLLPVGNQEFLRLGTSENVDAMIYISQLENVRLSLALDVKDPELGLFEYDGNTYLPTKVMPRSHIHGVPCYYRIDATRGTGLP